MNKALFNGANSACNNAESFRLLLAHGADPNLPFGTLGSNALATAVKACYVFVCFDEKDREMQEAITKILLEFGAKVDMANAMCETPLDFAKSFVGRASFEDIPNLRSFLRAFLAHCTVPECSENVSIWKH